MREIIETHIAEIKHQLQAIEKGLDGYKEISRTVSTAKLIKILAEVHLKLCQHTNDERVKLGPYNDNCGI